MGRKETKYQTAYDLFVIVVVGSAIFTLLGTLTLLKLGWYLEDKPLPILDRLTAFGLPVWPAYVVAFATFSIVVVIIVCSPHVLPRLARRILASLSDC